jgi:hypothetical protein
MTSTSPNGLCSSFSAIIDKQPFSYSPLLSTAGLRSRAQQNHMVVCPVATDEPGEIPVLA